LLADGISTVDSSLYKEKVKIYIKYHG